MQFPYLKTLCFSLPIFGTDFAEKTFANSEIRFAFAWKKNFRERPKSKWKYLSVYIHNCFRELDLP